MVYGVQLNGLRRYCIGWEGGSKGGHLRDLNATLTNLGLAVEFGVGSGLINGVGG